MLTRLCHVLTFAVWLRFRGVRKHLPTLAFPGLSVYVMSRRTLKTDRRTMLRWLPRKIVRSFQMQLGPARGAET
jgi:hypothetical protein